MKKVDFSTVFRDKEFAEKIEWLSIQYEVELLYTENSNVYYFNDLQDDSYNRYMSLFEFVKWFYDDINGKIEDGMYIDGDYCYELYKSLKEYTEGK